MGVNNGSAVRHSIKRSGEKVAKSLHLKALQGSFALAHGLQKTLFSWNGTSAEHPVNEQAEHKVGYLLFAHLP